jgi:hypothetical protein
MTPLAHGVANLRPGLEHDRLHAAFQHVRGGSETDGARAQDGDGLGPGAGGVRHGVLLFY